MGRNRTKWIYTLVRSNQKTLAVQVGRGGEIIVRAPKRMSAAVIETFLSEKSDWLERARARMRALEEQRVSAFAGEGGTLWFLGKPYPVVLRDGMAVGNNASVWDGRAFFLPRQNGAAAAAAFFTEQARKLLPPRTDFFAEQAGLSYTSLAVGGARSRWGSCGADGRLRFSWRLLCTPPPAVDYVVAHELAHIRNHNHSRDFWKEVARIWRDWETGAAALRAFERQVDLRAL